MRFAAARIIATFVCGALGCGRAHVATNDASQGPVSSSIRARCDGGQCLVPAGKFIMGSHPDEPYRGRYTEEQREVTLTHDILYDQYELTQERWSGAGFPNLAGTLVDSAGGRNCTAPTCPATMMTWFEAALFANMHSRSESLPECFELIGCQGTVGVDYVCNDVKATTPSYYDCRGYRLPTMPEFQYAARAGTTTAFYSGPFDVATDQCVAVGHLDAIAWYCANSGNTTHPVGQKTPNAFGLHDMLGNVGEFAGSRPDGNTMEIGPTVDPNATLPEDLLFGWVGAAYNSIPAALRVSSQAFFVDMRSSVRAGTRGQGLGFRLVRSISREEAERWKQ